VDENYLSPVDDIVGRVGQPRFVFIFRLLRSILPYASMRERAFRWMQYHIKRSMHLIRKAWPNYEQRVYDRWLNENQPDPQTASQTSLVMCNSEHKQLFSIILNSSGHNPEEIENSVRSIKAQEYQHWELWIFVLDSVEREVPNHFESWFLEDDRIHLKSFNRDLDSFSDVLETIEGDFIVFLSQGDTLAPDALQEVVDLINLQPSVDMIYTDEDKIHADKKRRMQPWFKPDWSPELLLSVNYLTPPIIQREIVAQVAAGGWNPGDEKDIWDLIFRCVGKSERIAHIPKVLYHAKFISSEINQKTESLGVVASHLKRFQPPVVSECVNRFGARQVFWPVRQSLISIIIPTKDHPYHLRRCLDGLLNSTDYKHIQIIIVDNGSVKQETLAFYDQIRDDARICFVMYDEEFNFSRANNLGAQCAKGDHFLFLNDDIEVIEEDWLVEMVRWSERDEIGVVGAKLLFPDGSIQQAGVVVGMGGHAGHIFRGAREGENGPFGSVEWYRNYLAVTGACMMIPKLVFEEVGGFKEDYKLAFSDVDLCLRITKRGYRVLYTPFARLTHHESLSRGRYIPTGDLIKAYNDFIPHLSEGDPYYNPNLSYRYTIPRLTLSPEDRIMELEKILARRLLVEGLG
jgi:GT2 family glycosyltransferase